MRQQYNVEDHMCGAVIMYANFESRWRKERGQASQRRGRDGKGVVLINAG
jgi:hypothetical protein